MGQRKTRSAISAYKGNLIRARRRARSGNIERAIEAYDEVIGEIIHIGHEQITAQPMILRDLQDTVERILELLRWTQDYDRALSLLDRVKQDVPQMAGLFDADEALLLISAGRADEGFARLRAMTEAEPTNIWLWCLLGSEYAALELYPEAENCLRTAVGIADAPASDRAEAYWLLFDLYRRQRDANKAAEAWSEACKEDPSFEAFKPEVCRTYIELRRFDKAMELLKEDDNETRRYFYLGLIEWRGGGQGYYGLAKDYWRRVADQETAGLRACPDEYAEACLYMGRPRQALDTLRPLTAKRDVNPWRLMLSGLAYALLSDLPRAKQSLDAALRLADSCRPRQTRPGTGKQRILNQQARIAYGGIITGTDLRAHLDVYFIPLPSTAT